MEEKRIVIGKSISVNGITLIPVIQLSLDIRSEKIGTAFKVVKQPAYIVAVSTQAKKAYSTNGKEVSLDELMQEIPALKDMFK